MNNKKFLLVIILLFVIVLGGAYTLYSSLAPAMETQQLAVQESPVPHSDNSPEDSKERLNENRAPDFVVYDIDGNEVHLYDYLGKPIILNFWASWCGPCRMEMPDFNEKYLELGEEVQFLMINMTDGARETVDSASEFIVESAYSFPVVYDTDGNAAVTYGAYSLPTTYFIDRDGIALARATGSISAETLQQGIDLIK